MSIETPPPTADALVAAAKGMGDNDIQALVARLVIDSLGRSWDPAKHPRDSEGKFIETFAEVRALFRTEGGAKGKPQIAGRVVAFDQNGDVLIRVDHAAPGSQHKTGDLVRAKGDDIVASQAIAKIARPLNDDERGQLNALADEVEPLDSDAAAALRRAADPANTESISQLADLHEARDFLDDNPETEITSKVRDLVWDLSDKLGDNPSQEEILKEAKAIVRDNMPEGTERARLDADISAPAPAPKPQAPDVLDQFAAALYRMADQRKDQFPADSAALKKTADALSDAAAAPDPEKRDSLLERASLAANKITTQALRKKIQTDIKFQRANPPDPNALPENAEAPFSPNQARARMDLPPAAPLPETDIPDEPASPEVPAKETNRDDLGATVPKGWEREDQPNMAGVYGYTKDGYAVYPKPDDQNYQIISTDLADAAYEEFAPSWAEVQDKIAAHDAEKNAPKPPPPAGDYVRQAVADDAKRLGLSDDTVDVIKNGSPDEIEAALAADPRVLDMRNAYIDAAGADAWNADQKNAFEDWGRFQTGVMARLKKNGLLPDKPGPSIPPRVKGETPAYVPEPKAEIPAYSGEQRPVQPRDLAQIYGAVADEANWLNDYPAIYDFAGKQAPLRDDAGAVEELKKHWADVSGAVRDRNYVEANRKLDAIENMLNDPDVDPEVKKNSGANVAKARAVLDKVQQRDQGQLEIPGAAPESVAPFADLPNPELNAAFADVVDVVPEANANVKALRDAMDDFIRSNGGGDYDRISEDMQFVANKIDRGDYVGALEDARALRDAEPDTYGVAFDDMANGPEVVRALSAVEDDFRVMLSGNEDLKAYLPDIGGTPDFRPETPAVEQPVNPDDEPLAEWEKALLEGVPDAVPNAEREVWKEVVAQLDEQMGRIAGVGELYNGAVQDGRMDAPQIRDAVNNVREELVDVNDVPALAVLDAILLDNGVSLAGREAVIPDPPKGGASLPPERGELDPRIRGEIEDVKRGVGLPELGDRLDLDRNGVAVFPLDLMEIPAAGNQGPQGGMKRPGGVGQIRRIYKKGGVTYAEVAMYDPAFVDAPNRNRAKAAEGLKNNDPFFVFDGVRLDKLQKADPENENVQEFLGHLGPEEARQYAGRNAGRLAQRRGRVRPELERMADLQYIEDRIAYDKNGLPIGKGDVVTYRGKKYEVVRIDNDNPGVGDNRRVDLVPLGANNDAELVGGGKHAQPYARQVEFYDKPLDGRDPGVSVQELKEFLARIDKDRYPVGADAIDAVDRGDYADIVRTFNDDPAIQAYVADGRAYIRNYVDRLLDANRRGDFKAIKRNEQEMIRKDKNDLLNIQAAMKGRFLEGTGADRHLRREVVPAGPDRDYKGNRPEVLMPLRYVEAKDALGKVYDENPGDPIWDDMVNAVSRVGRLDLDDEGNRTAVLRELMALRTNARVAGQDDLADKFGALVTAIQNWENEQAIRRGMVQGGPGREAQLPGGRTVAPGLIREPGMSGKPATPDGAAGVLTSRNQEYEKLVYDDADFGERFMNFRDALLRARDEAKANKQDDVEGYLNQIIELQNDLMYGEALAQYNEVHAIDVAAPNADVLEKIQEGMAGLANGGVLNDAFINVRKDFPGGIPEFDADGVRVATPAAPARPRITPEMLDNMFGKPGRKRFFERAGVAQALQDLADGKSVETDDLDKLKEVLQERVNSHKGRDAEQERQYQEVLDGVNGVGAEPTPAAPATPAVPFDKDIAEKLLAKGDRFIRPAGKQAVRNMRDGKAPDQDDLAILREDIQKRLDYYEGRGGAKLDEYQKAMDEVYRVGDAAAGPDVPKLPANREEAEKGIDDAIDAEYELLREDRKNNEARKKARALEEMGDDLRDAIKTAFDYNDGDPDNRDTRDTAMNDAARKADEIAADHPELGENLKQQIDSIKNYFARGDAAQLIDQYLSEADKYHNAERPDNGQRDRMVNAAKDAIGMARKKFPDLADEMQTALDEQVAQYAIDDKERARAKPVGRTVAVANFDDMVEAERKRLRGDGKAKEARDLVDAADDVAAAINDAEDAHKGADAAERDAAIERARQAADAIEPINPDLAEAARQAVEGNAARFARADNRGPLGDDEIDTTERGAAILRAADEIAAIAQAAGVTGWDKPGRGDEQLRKLFTALTDARRAKKIRSAEYVGGGGFNGTPIVVVTNDGTRVVIKNDAAGNGARAEIAVGRIYRSLGFQQPLVTALGENSLRHFVVMEHLDDMTPNFLNSGVGDAGEFDDAGQLEALQIQLANAIMGSTDRHYGNIKYGRDEAGNNRLFLYDNGLAMFNGGFGEAFGGLTNDPHDGSWTGHRQGTYDYLDENVTPDKHILSSRTSGNVYVGHNSHEARYVALDWMETHTDMDIKSAIEELSERMAERARASKFLTAQEIEFITVRAGWASDNWETILKALYKLNGKKRAKR